MVEQNKARSVTIVMPQFRYQLLFCQSGKMELDATAGEATANYNPKQEQVLLVNEDNQPIGQIARQEMRAQRLTHRSTFIFVTNSHGQLYIQRRTPTKDIYPHYYDPSSGGVVAADDPNDEIAAQRELSEEMGIANVPLTFRLSEYWEDQYSKVWCQVFTAEYDGPIRYQPEEVCDVILLTPKEVLERAGQDMQFTPDSIFILRKLVENGVYSVENAIWRVTHKIQPNLKKQVVAIPYNYNSQIIKVSLDNLFGNDINSYKANMSILEELENLEDQTLHIVDRLGDLTQGFARELTHRDAKERIRHLVHDMQSSMLNIRNGLSKVVDKIYKEELAEV